MSRVIRRHGTALVVALLATTTALTAAASAVVPVVGAGSGLTAPQGLAVAPDGALWVGDPLLGVCRIVDGAPVRDGVTCGPEGTTSSPIVEVAGIAFASTATGTWLYVADPSSGSSGIWRLPFDAVTAGVGSPVKIFNAGDSRPQAVAVDVTGALLFSVQRDDAIRRIAGPSTCLPCPATTLTTNDETAAGLAPSGGDLYLAGAGVLNVLTAGAAQAPRPAPGFPIGPYGAVSADPSRARVYAATPDRVLVREDPVATVETYAMGFSGITAMALAPDGTLFIADDPTVAAGGLDTSNGGRIFASAVHPTNMPQASIVTAPAPVVGSGAVSFTVAGPTGSSLECAVDGGAFGPCEVADATPSTATHNVTLLEGPHTFRVRAVLNAVTGPEVTYVFRVDLTAPVALIDTTQTAFDHSGNAVVDFSANERDVSFACSLDDGPFVGCEPPRRLTGLGVGSHVLAVRPTDAAGNVGSIVSHRFTVAEPPPPSPPPPPPPPAESSGPANTPPATEQTPTPFAPVPVTGSALTLSSCRPVAPSRSVSSFVLVGRTLTLRTAVPVAARYLKVTLRHRSGATRGELLTLAVRRVLGSSRSVRLRLTPANTRRVASRLYRIGVAFGTCSNLVGKPQLAVRRSARTGAGR